MIGPGGAAGPAMVRAGIRARATSEVTEPPDNPEQVTDLVHAGDGILEFTVVDDGTGSPANVAIRHTDEPPIGWAEAQPTEVAITDTDTVGIGNIYQYDPGLTTPDTYEFQCVAYRGTLDVDAVFGTLSNTASVVIDGGEPEPLSSGSLVMSPSSADTIDWTLGAASGGTGPYSYQLYGDTTSPVDIPADLLSGQTGLSGTITGLTEDQEFFGVARVTDDVGATADSNEDSATPTAPSEDYPNLPAGMTVIGSNDGSVKESGGSAFGISDFGSWHEDPDGDISVIADATNPTGSGFSLQFTYGASGNPPDACGTARASTFTGGPFSKLYIMKRVFYDVWSELGGKFFYIGADQANRVNTSSPTQFYLHRPGSGDPSSIKLTDQNGSPTYDVLDSAPDAPIGNDRWLNIELLMDINGGDTPGNGTARCWVNETLVAENTDVDWDPETGFDGMEYYAWASADIDVDHIRRCGELFIAGA